MRDPNRNLVDELMGTKYIFAFHKQVHKRKQMFLKEHKPHCSSDALKFSCSTEGAATTSYQVCNSLHTMSLVISHQGCNICSSWAFLGRGSLRYGFDLEGH